MANQYEVVFTLQGELNKTFKQSLVGAGRSFKELSEQMQLINTQMTNTKGIEAQYEAYHSLGSKLDEQKRLLNEYQKAAKKEGNSTGITTKEFEKERKAIENLEVQRRRMMNDIRNACYANGHELLNIQELEANYFRLEKRLAKVAKIRRVALKQEGANYSR
jgi:hypothetical protein